MWRLRLALLAFLTPSAGAAAPPDVHYEAGRLSVHVDDVPLERVVERVREETGLEFRGELLDWREVNKQFDAIPLPEALDRILGRQNFILRYGADGRPSVVQLQGLPQPRETRRAGIPPARNVLHLLAAAPPVALSPQLRQALRADTARPMQLFLLGVQHATAGVRTEARQAFLRALEASRPTRDALVGADTAALIPLVRSLPAERVDESLADLGRRSGDPMLRRFFGRMRSDYRHDRAAADRRG